jgi:hypothetical protein
MSIAMAKRFQKRDLKIFLLSELAFDWRTSHFHALAFEESLSIEDSPHWQPEQTEATTHSAQPPAAPTTSNFPLRQPKLPKRR